jgi:hypothetical protein
VGQNAHDLGDLEHLPPFQNAVGVFHVEQRRL